MNCPQCRSRQTRRLSVATDLGYSRFQCRSCRRTFNERTDTPFNFLKMPTDIVFQVVLFRLLFKLSLRDLMHLFLKPCGCHAVLKLETQPSASRFTAVKREFEKVY